MPPTTPDAGPLPAWAEELRRRYLRGEASQFVVHGNVHDLVLHGGALVPVNEFLCRVLLARSQVSLPGVWHDSQGRSPLVAWEGPATVERVSARAPLRRRASHATWWQSVQDASGCCAAAARAFISPSAR